MSNPHETERQRLKLYGQMLKNDLSQKRYMQKLQKQSALKRDSLDIQKHIQNTRKYEFTKKQEQKKLNANLQSDNLMLSTIKRFSSLNTNQEAQGINFINQIHQFDSKRLTKLKQDLMQQYSDNKNFTANKRYLQERIKEIQKQQAQRHADKIKQIQMDSLHNYQEIKKKHQQDMSLYQKHKKLVEQNESFREQVQSFTRGRGIMDRYYRNQYQKRKANLKSNQDQILKQMQQLERRKNQQIIEYKRNVGNLQDSMLGSVLVKPSRYQARAYSNELRNQMREDNIKKRQQLNNHRQKVELNNIYGGVNGNERQKIVKIIDRSLGLDRYATINKSTIERPRQSYLQNNPEVQSQRHPTPKSTSRRQYQQKKQENINIPQQFTSPFVQSNHNAYKNQSPSQSNSNSSSQNRRYFKSYDLISGKNKFYG